MAQERLRGVEISDDVRDDVMSASEGALRASEPGAPQNYLLRSQSTTSLVQKFSQTTLGILLFSMEPTL